MTAEKVLAVIEQYRKQFEEAGTKKIDYPHDVRLPPLEHDARRISLEHCHGMLDRMVEFVHEGRMEKVFRWLGFIQGCLFSGRIYTIGQLANHNRPDPQ